MLAARRGEVVGGEAAHDIRRHALRRQRCKKGRVRTVELGMAWQLCCCATLATLKGRSCAGSEAAMESLGWERLARSLAAGLKFIVSESCGSPLTSSTATKDDIVRQDGR
jgi:hypothetical protein